MRIAAHHCRVQVEGDGNGWHRANIEWVAYELNRMLGKIPALTLVSLVAFRDIRTSRSFRTAATRFAAASLGPALAIALLLPTLRYPHHPRRRNTAALTTQLLRPGMDYVPPVAYRTGGVDVDFTHYEEGAFILFVNNVKELREAPSGTCAHANPV